MVFSVGDTYNQNFTVLDETYKGFIHLFKDNNPLHTDEQFAKMKGFADKVMHGNILNGFISYFIGECLPLKDVIIHSQQIQFKNPVYLEDELLFQAIVTGVYESVNVVEFQYEVKKKDLKVVAKGKFQIGLLL